MTPTHRATRQLIVLLLAALAPAAPAAAHVIQSAIADCGCDWACYSGNVTGLACTADIISFGSNGLPAAVDPMMIGIRASNQQFPRAHDFSFTITRRFRMAGAPTYTEPGAIGVAINGVPIFDPSTQGPLDPKTGKRPNTYEARELDACGGHAGRGDDYHYHMAPKCLIEGMGRTAIETEKKPIGYAMDGAPILALGWFDKANDIEAQLDPCRGATDANGSYFYNVKHTPTYDVLNCFSGQVDPRRFARDRWTARKDMTGADMVGIPIAFDIAGYEVRTGGGAACDVMTGTLHDAQILSTDGKVRRISSQKGALFYCDPGCYGQFLEADQVAGAHGRVIYFESPRSDCPAALGLADLKTFDPYEGPAQSRKAPPSTGR
jgi:YHYH protein